MSDDKRIEMLHPSAAAPAVALLLNANESSLLLQALEKIAVGPMDAAELAWLYERLKAHRAAVALMPANGEP